MSGILKSVRIAVLLNAVLGILLAVLVVVLGIATTGAYADHRRAARTARMGDAVGDVFRALQNTRLERGAFKRLIPEKTTASPAALAEVAGVRAKSNPAMDKVLAECADLDCGAGAGVADLMAARQALNDVRAVADKAVTQPQDQRPADLFKTWNAASDGLVAKLEAVGTTLGARISRESPAFASLIALKDASYVTRDAAGLERNILMFVLQGQTYTPAMQAQSAGLRGQLEAGWRLTKALSLREDVPDGVRQAMTAAEVAYFKEVMGLHEQIEKAVLAGTPSPVSLDQWMERSNASFEMLAAVPMAALDAARDLARREGEMALRRLIVDGVLLVLCLGLGAGGVVMVARRVTRPMTAMTGVMLRVARGDLEAEIPYADNQDEIGDLAGALGTFRANALERQRLEDTQRAEQAGRERRARAVDALVGEFDAQVRDVLRSVEASSHQLTQIAGALGGMADATSSQVTAAAEAAEQTSGNVQTVSAAAEQMESSVREIGQQVAHSSSMASKAVDEAEQTNGTVASLAEAAQRIGDVVKMINDIASQTNLLALNATIEAARAGEAGKGFAVVAHEVKQLAGQTAKATDEIGAQITAIQKATDQAVGAIGTIGHSIRNMSEVSTAIAAAVEEQAAATGEISRNVRQAADATRDVSRNVADVSAAVGETGRTVADMHGAAQGLTGDADRLRDAVDRFLAGIRAA
ncbi:methyl-accepting chemotaxis protein [Nitrospirillum amazonense]|uniref:Methyl-accepting chemotaxis protein n=1 Tax=Nitrospirillum amazonense TaxID=28077 RepID=A0A560FA59_9PROT|nr:HAMP domain-containing methyl-accepting chemotaxis protein [Nitrospirillum amazonense]TWB18486.1 methyl-accepting chemotaxis protein [Nitrospirillum amazonense]